MSCNRSRVETPDRGIALNKHLLESLAKRLFAGEPQYPWIPEALSWPLPWHSKEAINRPISNTSQSPRNFASLAVAGLEGPLHRNLKPPWAKDQAQASRLILTAALPRTAKIF